jgi:hypothetical protein
LPVHDVQELIDFGHFNSERPTGYARFIFRVSSIPEDIYTALPYLDGRPLAVLAGDHAIAQQLPATVTIDALQSFPAQSFDEAAENELIKDYSPRALEVLAGFGPRPVPPPPPPPPISTLRLLFKLLDPRWLVEQLRRLRKQGLRARLAVFKGKLGL